MLAPELPQTVDMEIVETALGIKGASASACNKPATMATGLVIQRAGIPFSAGDKIRIHIAERRYMSRADYRASGRYRSCFYLRQFRENRR